MSSEVSITTSKSVVAVTSGTQSIEVSIAQTGPQGPPGAPGSAGASYLHTQAVASAEWIVNHNLGTTPDVEVRSIGGAVVETEVLHIDANQTRIYFAAPYAGTARFS